VTPDEVMEEVRRIEVTTRHLVRDIVAGEYASVFRGRGVELADVREYQPGDDVRSIDWKVTARLGDTYVKRHVEERELTAMLVVDVSASQRFGAELRARDDLATLVASVLALAASRSGDRVGALLFTDRVERFVPPRKGRRHVLRVLSELIGRAPTGRGTDLAGALDFLDPVLRRRAVVFLISDFLADGYEAALDRVTHRHELVAIQLRDARERELPAHGLVALRDPESDDWRWVDADAARDALRRGAAAFDRELETRLRHRGADLLQLDAGRPYAEALVAFFRARERRRRH
jgi:uncharacterized protein (DUF58 family)